MGAIRNNRKKCQELDCNAVEQSICERFEQRAAASPNNLAVVDEGLQPANFWAEVRLLDATAVYGPFLELGGHSLQAARMLARVADMFRLELPLTAMFETPTLGTLAECIDRQHGPQRSAPATTSSLIDGARE